MGKRKMTRRAKRLTILATVGLFGGVVYQELQKPKDERHWHGRLAGVIPYDLRPPTIQRLKSAMWSPDSSKIFMPRAFGIGWDVNFGRLFRLLKKR